MKSYKQLREKWLTSFQNKSYSGRISNKMDIYVNPNMKELKDIQNSNKQNAPRGFLAPNGKVYIASTSIHPWIMDRIDKIISRRKSIPIVIWFDQNPTQILIGDFIGETEWSGDKNRNRAAKVIYANPWLNRLFRGFVVIDDYMREIKRENI